MPARVICFGATGFTGRLAAEAMTRAGLAPVLAGRSEQALVELVARLAPFAPIDAAPTWQRADASDPVSVRRLVTSPDDVLVSTVGPFSKFGRAAVDAAIDQGCGYVDSTGEPSFIREVFEQDAERALATGARLLPAFGYDYVPGNLAGALALRDCAAAGGKAARIEIGYFLSRSMAMSSGTRASSAAMITEPSFSFRRGSVRDGSIPVATFDLEDGRRDGLPIGGSEHFALPRLARGLADVGVYLGWAGRLTRPAHAIGRIAAATRRVPVAGGLTARTLSWAAGGDTGIGPSAAQRSATTSIAIARTLDGVGRELSRVRVDGPSPYDLTADLLAWGAAMLHMRREAGPGVLGPADAFGVDALVDGCAAVGLCRVD
jgi:short subunit dehydrogenase-like uncharacterized protein